MKQIAILIFVVVVLGGAITFAFFGPGAGKKDVAEKKKSIFDGRKKDKPKKKTELKVNAENTGGSKSNARVYPRGEKLFFWWDEMPAKVTNVSFETGPTSNIHPEDYAGVDSCKKCHEQNFEDWANHPHRWMNAAANEETVKGSFTTEDILHYLGGKATFTKVDDQHRMTLERGDVKMVYDIDQTLGSRFFQYYIGRLIEGPYTEGHPYRTTRHVLPFGYWLQKKQWIPVVHVGPELPDGERTDPFAMPQVPQEGKSFLPYTKYCNMCHSTFAMGDNLFRKPYVLERHFPGIMHLDMAGYVKKVHSEYWQSSMTRENTQEEQIFRIPKEMTAYDAEDHGVSFGISCEACHFGCKEHSEDPKQLPSFAPRSEFLRVQNQQNKLETGRTHDNLNWACGRCHTGNRPLYAGGMSTWNSTEYTDAMKGSCYSQLNCIDCHQPHKATGLKWTKTPAQDDASCIRCHEQFSTDEGIAQHTHHPIGSEGSRCMNCHMPKINEGLQEVVRTHTIFSPTNKAMLESNHPNACNMCHTDQTIDWTTKYLTEWYGAKFDADKIAKNYKTDQKVGIGWLQSENEAVRLVAIDSMGRNKDQWAGENLVDTLNDPFLLNRQFALDVIEKVFEVKLEDFNYRFYMTPEERKEPIQRLKEKLGPKLAK